MGNGVFELYCRINHSCVPNVYNSYNATIQREVVHAVKPIAAREEILTSYIANARRREHRQDFRCTYIACTGPGTGHHERRRKEMTDAAKCKLFDNDALEDMALQNRSLRVFLSGADICTKPSQEWHLRSVTIRMAVHSAFLLGTHTPLCGI